jgi:2'-hydroxyisoflavone reductase
MKTEPAPASGSPRRAFLGLALAGSATLALAGLSLAGCSAASPAAAPIRPLRILILGGTGFIGPKTVEVALARGHQVAVFNRGRTEKRIPFGFEGVEHLYGNRDPLLPADDARGPDGQLLNPDASPKGLEQLAGRAFDVVIDNSGYYPRHVKASADLLAANCGRYIYISSISAYADNKKPGADEDYALAQLADPTVETMGEQFENYGGLKVLCEQAAQAAFPGRCAVVRPGYIVGPGDPTDRFTWWPVRIAKGGEIPVPGKPEDPMQWIDSRDLAEFLVKLAEDGTTGAFNACGPGSAATTGEVVAAAVKLAMAPCDVKWVSADFQAAQAAAGAPISWPIWSNPAGDEIGFHTWSNARAVKAGLKFRSLEETLRGTLDWWPTEVERRGRVGAQLVEDAKAKGQPPPTLPDPELLRQGPSAAQEAAVLKALAEASAKR